MSYLCKQVNFLLKKLKHGKTEYQRPLYDFTFNHLKRIAAQYAKDKSLCEDITVEAFHRIFRYVSSYDETKDGYNWMCKIVQHTAYGYNENTVTPYISLEQADKLPSAINFEEKIEERDAVFTAVEKLSAEENKMFDMRFILDLTYKQIAQELGVKKSTARKRVMKMVKTLSRLIKDAF